MDTYVDEDAIRQLAKKIAKDIKTEADLGDFSKLLKKIVVETALEAELTDHLGYDKHNAKGMSTRDICATFKELYDADVSPTIISKVTDAVMGRVTEWQSRTDVPGCLSGLYCCENQRKPAGD